MKLPLPPNPSPPSTNATSSPDSVSDTDHPLRIDTTLLIPGRGSPIQNATLISQNGKITHIGPTSTLPHHYTTLQPNKVPVLMPGLADAHVHFLGMTSYSVTVGTLTPPALAGARSARDLAATLNAGYTFVRELAGHGIELSTAIRENWLPGPTIYSSSAILSTTAGHGDARDVPRHDVEAAMCNGLPFYLCDGVEECVKAVRTMVRRGAKCIKLATSGGVASEDSPWTQQFSAEEVRAVVEEARRWGLNVAAHAHGKAGVRVAVEAGVNSIEHGSEIDESTASLMKDRGITLVATRSVIEFGLRHEESWTPDQAEKIAKLGKNHWESYRRCVEKGVKIALGTDVGVSTEMVKYNHGMNAREVGLAVKAGLTPLQAIEAGTVNVVETLGSQAPKKGMLKVGWDADLIALEKSPLEDAEILAESEEVRYVWKEGRCFKCSGKLVGLVP